jgi:hypothetical protein
VATPRAARGIATRVFYLPANASRFMCGRRLIDKSFFTLMQHWSGAVMCVGAKSNDLKSNIQID